MLLVGSAAFARITKDAKRVVLATITLDESQLVCGNLLRD